MEKNAAKYGSELQRYFVMVFAIPFSILWVWMNKKKLELISREAAGVYYSSHLAIDHKLHRCKRD